MHVSPTAHRNKAEENLTIRCCCLQKQYLSTSYLLLIAWRSITYNLASVLTFLATLGNLYNLDVN